MCSVLFVARCPLFVVYPLFVWRLFVVSCMLFVLFCRAFFEVSCFLRVACWVLMVDVRCSFLLVCWLVVGGCRVLIACVWRSLMVDS